MATTLDFESDQFLELLTDALRAGPGSPAWHQALLRLGSQDAGEAEQYRKLIEARERLESGREYRSVRAGAGFTARVMRGVDEASSGESAVGRMPSAGSIAMASAVLGLAVMGILVWFLYGGGGEGQLKSADALANLYFGQTVLAAPMNGRVPGGWRQIGKLPLDFAGGELRPAEAMRPGGLPGRGGGAGAGGGPAGAPGMGGRGPVGGGATTRGGGGGDVGVMGARGGARAGENRGPAETRGPGARGPGAPNRRGEEAGGIVIETPIAPRQPVLLAVTLRFDQVPEDFIPEVFVADAGDFNDQATSANELTWLIENRRPQVVLPDGQFAGRSDEIKDDHGPMTVQIRIDGNSVLVQTDGREVWWGELGLTDGKPLYLGVRFRRSGAVGAKPSHVSVVSLSVQEP
jgi:hypothetical protein